MTLLKYYRSLDGGVQSLISGTAGAVAVLLVALYGEPVLGGLRFSTQITLGGTIVTGAISLWSTRQMESHFERYVSRLLQNQVHLARTVDNIDEGTSRMATDGGTKRGDRSMTGARSEGGIDADAAFAGALVVGGLFAAVTLGAFGEFVGEGFSPVLAVVVGIGGVLGARFGDWFVRRGRTVGDLQSRPLPAGREAEFLKSVIERSDVDERELAELLTDASAEETGPDD